jgi:hypothetical protein
LRGIESEDPSVAFRAAEALVQRIYGKPTEHVKTEAVPTGLEPEDLAKLPRDERRRVMRELCEAHPDLAQRILGPQGLAAVAKPSDSTT